MRPQAMLEAKDLPRCDLSEFLEDRLAKALERDLHMRAQRKGIPIEQVLRLWSAMPVLTAVYLSGIA